MISVEIEDIKRFAERYGATNIKYESEWSFAESPRVAIGFDLQGLDSLLEDTVRATDDAENNHQAVNLQSIYKDGGDIIIVKVDFSKVPIEAANSYVKHITTLFPDKTVVALPKEIDVSCTDKSTLCEWQKYISKLINDLSFNNIMNFNKQN